MNSIDETNESADMSADEIREGYNTAILETAQSFQSANAEDGEADDEMNAQIEIVQAAWAAGDVARTDSAIDHLRTMLEISYLGEEDMPGEAPAARGESPAPAGAPDEVFTITFQMTRAQIRAMYPGLETMAQYPNSIPEERATEILLGALPNEAFNA